MSEQLRLEPPLPSDEATYSWIHDAGTRGALFDRVITYDRGRGPEQFTVDDALPVSYEASSSDTNRIDSLKAPKFPGMELTDTEGKKLTIDARDYLKQSGFDKRVYWQNKHVVHETEMAATALLRTRQEVIRLANEDQKRQSIIEQGKQHYHELFAPLIRPENTQLADSVNGNTRIVSQAEYDLHVNDITRADAVEVLTEVTQKDSAFRSLLETFSDKLDLQDPLAVVDAIRTNADIRYQVGTYYVRKMFRELAHNPDAFGERIRGGKDGGKDEKMTHGIVPLYKVNRHDYVALLCLDKLGGSFNGRSQVTGEKQMLKPEDGQHRPAADYLLAA